MIVYNITKKSTYHISVVYVKMIYYQIIIVVKCVQYMNYIYNNNKYVYISKTIYRTAKNTIKIKFVNSAI